MDGIKEDGAPANATGSAVAGTGGGVHWSKKQPRMGVAGKLKKYGQPILFKTLRRKNPVNEAKSVYYKILKKRVPAVSRTSAMGDGSDGSE